MYLVCGWESCKKHELIRLALGVHCFTHVDDNQFRQLGWLPIDRRVAHLKKKVITKVINNRDSVNFNTYFSRVNVKHCYYSRQSIMDLNLCRNIRLCVGRGCSNTQVYRSGISYLWKLRV